MDDKTRLKIITAVNNVKSDDFQIEEILARRSGSFLYVLYREFIIVIQLYVFALLRMLLWKMYMSIKIKLIML